MVILYTIIHDDIKAIVIGQTNTYTLYFNLFILDTKEQVLKTLMMGESRILSDLASCLIQAAASNVTHPFHNIMV